MRLGLALDGIPPLGSDVNDVGSEELEAELEASAGSNASGGADVVRGGGVDV